MRKFSKKLKKPTWKEQKNTIGIISVVVISVIIILLFLFPVPGKSTQITGKVVRLSGSPNRSGDSLYIVVQLGDGSKVMSYIASPIFYKKGKRVKLLKIEPLLIIGMTKYHFQGYVDEQQE